MRNKLGAITRDSIPYVRAFRDLAGSVTGALLFQQLEYWFASSPDGFYKFMEPAPGNKLYRAGDSWTEELAFSAKEFVNAFDDLGLKHASKNSFEASAQKFLGLYNAQRRRWYSLEESKAFPDGEVQPGERVFLYSSYQNKNLGVTWYFRNHPLVDEALNKVLREHSGRPPKGISGRPPKGISGRPPKGISGRPPKGICVDDQRESPGDYQGGSTSMSVDQRLQKTEITHTHAEGRSGPGKNGQTKGVCVSKSGSQTRSEYSLEDYTEYLLSTPGAHRMDSPAAVAQVCWREARYEGEVGAWLEHRKGRAQRSAETQAQWRAANEKRLGELDEWAGNIPMLSWDWMTGEMKVELPAPKEMVSALREELPSLDNAEASNRIRRIEEYFELATPFGKSKASGE